MKKYIACLSLLALDVHGVTLEEAIVAAYNNNAGWLAAQAKKNEADEHKKHAQAAFLPTVDASLTATRSAKDEEPERNLFGRSVGGHTVSSQTTTNMALNVRQNLFRSFQDLNSYRAASNSAKATFHALKKAEQDLIMNVVAAYTAVWAERQKLKAHKKKEENVKKMLEAQQVCLTAGTATPADVAEAEAKYHEASYERVAAETQVVTAESTFRQITGLKPDANINLPMVYIDLPKDLEEMKKITMGSNHEILSSQFAEKSAMDELNVARGKLGPQCDLMASAGKILSKSSGDPTTTRDLNYQGQLYVSMPIFNVQNYTTVSVYSERAKQAHFSAQDKKFEIKKNCEVYWREYIAAEAGINASRSAVKSAEITSESNLDQATLGLKSNTEFLDGETSLLNARKNLATSLKNRIDALVKLYALTGKLDLMTAINATKKKKVAVKKQDKENKVPEKVAVSK